MTTIAELTEKKNDLSEQLGKVNTTRHLVTVALDGVENLKMQGIALEKNWVQLLTQVHDGLDTLETSLEEQIADIEG